MLATTTVREERKQAFDRAKEGVPEDVVDRIMRGLPTEIDGTEQGRLLRQAWAHYHECL